MEVVVKVHASIKIFSSVTHIVMLEIKMIITVTTTNRE